MLATKGKASTEPKEEASTAEKLPLNKLGC